MIRGGGDKRRGDIVFSEERTFGESFAQTRTRKLKSSAEKKKKSPTIFLTPTAPFHAYCVCLGKMKRVSYCLWLATIRCCRIAKFKDVDEAMANLK